MGTLLRRVSRPLLTSPSPAHPSATALFAFLGILALAPQCSRAAVPAYVEEWATPDRPEDVEVDPSGRVWVSCADDSIRVYAPTGGQLLFAFGGTGSGDGEFQTPYGMAFDAAGDVFICDYAGARVEKFSSAGVFQFAWSVPSTHADHVAVDAAGDVYVTGFLDTGVHKYTAAGAPLTTWYMNGGQQNAGIVATGGVVHVVGWSTPFVEQFATDGTYLGTFNAGTLGGDDIESDALGQLWLTDYYGNEVRIFSSAGALLDLFGVPGAGPGEFNGAIGLAIGLDGSVYVADENNFRIQRFLDPATAIRPTPMPSTAHGLRMVSPNPSREAFAVQFTLGASASVLATISDVQGRTVATLADGPRGAGTHLLRWTPAADTATGVYFLRLTSGGVTRILRLVRVD